MSRIINCKTGETCRTYKEYLQTRHWLNVRLRHEAKAGSKKCWVCGSNKRIQYHHNTYERLGSERLSDIVPLCYMCHEKSHELLGAGKNPHLTGHNTLKAQRNKPVSTKPTKQDLISLKNRMPIGEAGKLNKGNYKTYLQKYGVPHEQKK